MWATRGTPRVTVPIYLSLILSLLPPFPPCISGCGHRELPGHHDLSDLRAFGNNVLPRWPTRKTPHSLRPKHKCHFLQEVSPHLSRGSVSSAHTELCRGLQHTILYCWFRSLSPLPDWVLEDRPLTESPHIASPQHRGDTESGFVDWKKGGISIRTDVWIITTQYSPLYLPPTSPPRPQICHSGCQAFDGTLSSLLPCSLVKTISC